MTAKESATAQRFEWHYILREWWRVTVPGREPFEVFLCPAATQGEVLARYPGSGCVPI